MPKNTSSLLQDALNLAKTLNEKELADLSRVINEIQRDDFTLRGRDVLRGIIRDFVSRADQRDSRENAIVIRRALDPLKNLGGNPS